MSSEPVAICVDGVSKHYLMFDRPEHRLRQMVLPKLQRAAGMPPRQYHRTFAALQNVSFEVRRGETVGIIGRNGSGKSTLLQIVCGTLNPTKGKVTIKGRVAALLELGAGFNPDFTGRENVYFNAAILGLKRHEVDERFDAIARFADIGQFIEQPVKTYSSGMYVRLAFATAINVDPDILVVDEALAVGDESFRRKCYARIEQIQDRGGTILFVSHGVQTIVQLCSRAILFDGGEMILDGDPKTVTGQYQRLVNATGADAKAMRAEIRALRVAPSVLPDEAIMVASVGDEDIGVWMATTETTPVKPSPPPPPVLQTAAQPLVMDGEYFDPKLVSQSRVDYPSQGARIRDLRLLNLAGKQVNVLEMGLRYIYEYFVDFDLDARKVGYGMMVNTVSGLSIGGIGTGNGAQTVLNRVARGSILHARIEFDARLVPGTYFLNAGVTGTTEATAGFLARVLDGLAFRIAPRANSTVTGLVDLGVEPKGSVTMAPAERQAQ